MKLTQHTKRITSLILLVVMVLVMQIPVLATDTNKFIKVGLTRELAGKSQMTINNKEINVGYNYENYNNLPLNMKANDSFTVKGVSGYFVQLPEIAPTAEEIKSLQDTYTQLGVKTIISMVSNNEYGLLIGPFNDLTLAQLEVENILSRYSKTSTTRQVSSKLGLYVDGTLGVVFESGVSKPQATTYVQNSFITISNTYKYRGAIEFVSKNGTIQPVNVVALEHYLYGVVPSEMPSSWHTEALKAQSVAARTYVYTKLSSSKHSAEGYHICDSTHCQVYKGMASEQPSTNAAIDATKGVVAYYNNALIEALFYSSNGGSTASSEDVWSTTVPYLRAKKDPYETNDSKWTRTFTQAELTSFVLAKQSNLGTVQNVRIDKTDSFGRAIAMTFVCTNGDFTVKNDAIRSFFSKSADGSLRSTNFKITQNLATTGTVIANDIDNVKIYSNGKIVDYTGNMTAISSNGTSTTKENSTHVIDSTGKVTNYSKNQAVSGGNLVLSGAGWGHGAGLSQFGAKGMAEQGHSYEDILKFYYTGIDLR